MSYIKKNKIKTKNLLIFLVCLLIITGSIWYGIKLLNTKNQKSEKITQTKEEVKLKQLNNIHKEIDYFNKEYLDRYLAYKKKNPSIDIKDIITEVNIGLDYNYYEHTKETSYLNKNYILVNKYNHLPDNYIPEDLEEINLTAARSGMKLTKEAKLAFEKMAEEAKKDNMTIIAMSSYRSYQYQVNLYNRYVQNDGKEAADTYSGRPGFSEHQTGLAVDVYNGKEDYTNFEKTKEFNWMQKNGHKYGFILRFPSNKTKQTGYQYESWHYRYVGLDLATKIHTSKLSLEEYYARNIENKKMEA